MDMDKPGVGKETFTLTLDKDWMVAGPLHKEGLLAQLEFILMGDTLVKYRVDEVAAILDQLYPLLTDEEKENVSSAIRTRIQIEALGVWRASGHWGAILMATGVGKSRVGVLESSIYESDYDRSKVLITVPTEKLRDEGWKNEFVKWGKENIWDKRVERACYASLSKYQDRHFHLMVMDEGHNVTPLNATFFINNKVNKLMWLSGTKPRDEEKKQLLKQLNINPVYEITLDEAVKLKLVSPYDITIVTVKLDRSEKYIKAGNATKGYFQQTEYERYQWMTKRIISYPSSKMFRLDRMRFIYNLKSKTNAAKWILDHVIPEDKRTLIFAGSKVQANDLCDFHYYSKPSKPTMPKKLKGSFDVASGEWDTAIVGKLKEYKTYIQKKIKFDEDVKHYHGDVDYDNFINMVINRMSCCEALNEGHNIPNLDFGFIAQVNSNELDLWQRIGRVIRFRAGHTGRFIILCAEETVDAEWVSKATKNLEAANIRTISFEDLKSGKETIKFD